jgi:hypothetical protein
MIIRALELVLIVALLVFSIGFGATDWLLQGHRLPGIPRSAFALPGPWRWRREIYQESGGHLVDWAWRAFGSFFVAAIAFLIVRFISAAA